MATKKRKNQKATKISQKWGYGLMVSEAAACMADHQVLNSRQGHGYAAERMNHQRDTFLGKDAKIVGGGNLKNGPDRLVDGVYMQTKYCRTPEATFGELFDKGLYRYINSNGRAMVVEVPSDQYSRVIVLMKRKIAEGKIPGYRNPERARELVRKGHFTYAQAANMAIPGTVESLKYDLQTGIVTCTYAAGISAALTVAWHIYNGGEYSEALAAGLRTGVEVFGVTILSHIATQQIGRTIFSEASNRLAAALVTKLPQGVRNFGAAGIQGSSVNNPTSTMVKAVKGHIMATAVTSVVLSSKDAWRMCKGEISKVQFVKNVSVVVATTGGGAAGAWGARSLAVALGCTGPWGLLAATLLGGAIGAEAGGKTMKYIVDKLKDDDVVELKRILLEQLRETATRMMLTGKELREKLHQIMANKDWNDFFYKMHASENRELYARDWCWDTCARIMHQRKPIDL